MESKPARRPTFSDALYLQLQGRPSGPYNQAQVKEAVFRGLAAGTDQISTTGPDGPWVDIRATSLRKYLPQPAAAALAAPIPTPAQVVAPAAPATAPAKVPAVSPAVLPSPGPATAGEDKREKATPKSLPPPVRLPRSAPRRPAPEPKPAREKHIWGGLALCAVILAGLAGAAMFFLREPFHPGAPAIAPTNADFANRTYDLIMESNELWSDKPVMRLRLEPDQSVTISQSAAPIDQVAPIYHRWAIENSALVFRNHDHQACDQYPSVQPGQKELAGMEDSRAGKHHLVRVRP